MTDRRTIRIRYAVTIDGEHYSSPGFVAGETIEPTTPESGSTTARRYNHDRTVLSVNED